jgi:hypothetical protein
LCRECRCDHRFTAAAGIEQRHRFGDDIASERRIDFLYDDVETADDGIGPVADEEGGAVRQPQPPGTMNSSSSHT